MWQLAAAQGATGLIGAYMQSRAMKSAEKQQRKGMKLQAQAIQAGQAQLNRIYADTAPARQHLLEVVRNDPNKLRPDQKVELQGVRNRTQNQLSTTGLRGSGKAQSGVLRRVEADGYGGMIADNNRRSDLAAGYLTGQGYNAAGQSAAMNLSLGNVYGDAGAAKGDSILAQSAAWGKGIGSAVGGFAGALEEWQRSRGSRYAAGGGSGNAGGGFQLGSMQIPAHIGGGTP